MTNGQNFNNISLSSGNNGLAIGSISISGTLTIPSGSTFVIL
jgi:hypothetical protein